MDVMKKYEDLFNVDFDSMIKIPEMFDSYKARSLRKNREFSIPFFIFDMIVKQPCFYCGLKKDLKIVGIDRLDNKLGYVSGNCVAACWDCNKSKGTKTLEEHTEYLKRFNPKYITPDNIVIWKKR